MNTQNKLINFDQTHVWHPYTSMTEPLPSVEVISANGVRLRLADGRELIDGMSSWWCAIHGYNVPELNRAIEEQLKKMSHVMFGGITHEPAVRLAKKLIDLTPPGLDRVFLCDSGSVSVEVAMKMAIQYWHASGNPEKHRFLSLKNGYHGDTFNAMSVCDPVTGMHEIYSGILPQNIFAPSPKTGFYEQWDESDTNELEQLMKKNRNILCAVIIEPIVQGAGGMRFYHPEYLKKVRALCTEHDILLITDEIATGFGRTGKLFACEHSNICPDIMTVGKAMTGGYMTMAATLATERVAKGISRNSGVFMHGPTFMANPLACAVSCASIDLLMSSPWQEKIQAIEKHMKEALAPCSQMDHVKDVRVLGAIGVVELKHPVDQSKIQKKFIREGIWVRPFGRLVYIMPPFVISKTDLEKLTESLVRIIIEEKK